MHIRERESKQPARYLLDRLSILEQLWHSPNVWIRVSEQCLRKLLSIDHGLSMIGPRCGSASVWIQANG
jgi:hypothetical protein